MIRSRARAWGALVATAFAGAAACADPIEVPDSNFALLTVAASEGEPYTTRPSGLFFRSPGVLVPSGIVGQDSCETQLYPGDVSVPDLDYLDAGPSVTVRLSGETGLLVPMAQNGVESYAMVPGTSIAYTPGDTAQFEIPGAAEGFAALTVRAKTAEAFVAQPIVVAQNASEVAIRWTAATPSTGSAMSYEFRYARGSTVLNRRLLCFLVDDGSADLSATALREFAEATIRETRATRIRIRATRVGETVSHVTSTFLAPVTVTVTP